ncbi:hypothetical protein ACFL27_03025 [candidate division CSSED10-310 bacterium]|uniref:Uncharacterized protein n=1 Tax=candidate division CSSED10-310 bacterium TaxID=2855610 RepID=A0ABV6YSH6_UNCC1
MPPPLLLIEGNKYLIQEKPLAYVLSATVFSESKNLRKSDDNELSQVAFGDPVYTRVSGQESHDAVVRSKSSDFTFSTLPATRIEVENICNVT